MAKIKEIQLDLFDSQESQEEKIYKIKIKQELMQKSFFARYHAVIKEMEQLRDEIYRMELIIQGEGSERSRKARN
jgi:hypothetical protein